MKYKFNVTATAYQKKGLMYLYDRCCFAKFLYLRKRKYVSFAVPTKIYPSLNLNFLLNDLTKNLICISKQDPGLLFFRLVLDALGVLNTVSFLKLLKKNQNSYFSLSYTSYITSFSSFEYLGTASVILKSLISVLNPVYTIQSFLYKVVHHYTGFFFFGSRLDSFICLKWFDLVQSLFGLSDVFVLFNIRFNPWFPLLLNLILKSNNNSNDKKGLLQFSVFISSFIGIHPRYFDYLKIMSGLSFKIVYMTHRRVRLLN